MLPGILFPVYRVLIIGVGVLIAGGLYWVVVKTRVGMLIRAGASNRRMVEALRSTSGISSPWSSERAQSWRDYDCADY